MTTNTYECTICLNINHASHTHCSTCGTIPSQYSILGVDSVEHSHESGAIAINYFIPIVVARGADRAEHHRTSRVYLRTVPADYYGSAF